MREYDAYLIDLDGTIYQGTKPIPAAKRFISKLQKANIPYLFVTNNSTKTPADVARNLSINHDIPTSPKQVYTSALATADYLAKAATPGHQTVYMIGEEGLKVALSDAGFNLIGDDRADYVVTGLDRQLTYAKLANATLAIQKGARFIATNADTNLPSERGMLPGAGTIVQALQTATNVKPTIIAKPSLPIMTGALSRLGNPQHPIMVGDNYHTDILAGINAKIDTLLVYSGVSTPEQIQKMLLKPTHSVQTLDEWAL
ncbi:TIGR01457 family HAD-type hydrolase [Convivina intestini]|uniref:Acid sugar phosphatase n=1 Tax=Convivina intestini TaxID=1505726 RepID=A0A2U1D9R6_9LACO|nr:TIGR01457 family HAD-type hydrolase [Convivina intestini]PVY84369.1 4-nitrophenyl phosphatase [Convivina intestini]CAH1857141.1 Acid sugar phosphatase [Convivina intestini]SDC07471.1 4-nitrophenyl phosphatase [Leuconostocaceae bacterium R-53105]